MYGQHIPARFNIVALAALWGLAGFNSFQPAMVGLSLLLSLEIALLAPAERRAWPVGARRSNPTNAGKAWWS